MKPIKVFHTDHGREIFRIPVEAFPEFWVYVYLVLIDEMVVLIDAGSGFGDAWENLNNGLKSVSERVGKTIEWEDLTHILITHGHIDHFGGLTHIRPRTKAKIGIHEFDCRILSNYEERLALVTHRLGNYFVQAGLSTEQSGELIDLYQLNKHLFRSIPVDFTYEEMGMALGPFQMLHTPGHCAGHVVIRLHDILFAGDHILDRTTPHMAPESLTLNTGLWHYLDSLERVRNWAKGVSLVLGGHEAPIQDLSRRIDEIQAHHKERLDKVLALIDAPKTVADISEGLFGQPEGYNAILAVEEAGAHIEYLYQRGKIRVVNFMGLEKENNPVPLKYERF